MILQNYLEALDFTLKKQQIFRFAQMSLHLTSQGKVKKVTDETNVMKALHSLLPLLMYELNKKH